jgi:L-ascorbate metabolism protein UlaG (beta-lactamase superfamily)
MKTHKNILLLFFFIAQLVSAQVMNVFSSDGQVQQFQVSEIDSITFGSTAGTLTWIGHASVRITTNEGVVIYIDPYAGNDYAEPADIILVSHGHSDHNQVGKVTQKEGCQIFSGNSADVGGTKMSAGDSVNVASIAIKAVEAYNDHHPKGTGIGFVIEINGIKIYHSGDTSKVPEMAELEPLHLDYAMLCIDGVYNMGPAEAMEAAELIKAKKVIPIHIAPPGASEATKQENIAKFNPAGKLVLKEGDTIYL